MVGFSRNKKMKKNKEVSQIYINVKNKNFGATLPVHMQTVENGKLVSLKNIVHE
jgi:hypothetical protein